MVTKTRFANANKANGPRAGANGKHDRSSTDGAWQAMQRAFGALGKRLPEMRQDLSYYTAVQVDRVRLAAANLATGVASRVLQLLTVAAISTVAVYLLIVGISGGVATALEGNVWLANLLTGAGTLALVAITLAMGAGSQRRSRLRRLQRRYRDLARSSNATATEVSDDVE